MSLNALVPELYVSDFAKSLHFYTEILGWELKYRREEPLFAFLEYQKSEIMIQQEDDDEEWHNGKPEYPFGRGLNFEIHTNNVQALIDSLEKNNYPIKRGLKDSWYRKNDILIGAREFLVMDPDGYFLRFSQSLGTKPANS